MAKQKVKKRKASKKIRETIHRSNPYFKKGFKRGEQPAQKAAAMGNQFWKNRTKHGRDKIFAGADGPRVLAEEAEKYFKWEDDNVFQRQELYKGKIVKIPQPPLYTIHSLSIYLGVSSQYFTAFLNNLKEDDPQRDNFLIVLEWVFDCIYQSKFSGATHGAFNANLIGYDLKIRQDVALAVANANSSPQIVVSDEKDKERLKLVKQKLNELDKKGKK